MHRIHATKANQITGWSHPIHIHLVDFQVVARSGSGRQGVTPGEAAALKDVIYLGTNGKQLESHKSAPLDMGTEQVDVIANFAPWSRVYTVSFKHSSTS